MIVNHERNDYKNINLEYGGLVYQFDFNTERPFCKHIADRIVADWKFDIECKRNMKNIQSRKEEHHG